jgi:Icc-related predicted phosphoesterase
MRLRILSDIHLEFTPYTPPEVEADVVILAGDIGTGVQGVRWARERFGDARVLYVPGNHEYYGEAFPQLIDEMRKEAEGSRVMVLNDDDLEIDGVRFLGSTLWTDFDLYGNIASAEALAAAQLEDYRRIRLSPRLRRLRPSDTIHAHTVSRRWLERRIAEKPGRTVVITHHAPSTRSIDPRYIGHHYNPAFVSNLDEMITRSGAMLWIHGHIHTSFDYRLGSTRVLCNPRGYPDEPDTGFNPKLLIDLDHAMEW